MFSLISLSLQQQVAHIYNKTNSTEEEQKMALSNLGLTACAANKDYVIDRLTTKFKSYGNWQNRKESPVNLLTGNGIHKPKMAENEEKR